MNRLAFWLLAAVSIIAILAAGTPAVAQQSNFSVAPPPIASPYFEAGKGEGKFRFTYLTISGESMDLKGGGFDFVGRSAFSEHFAGDIAFGFLFLTADIADPTGGEGTMNLVNIPFSMNLEFQPYNGDILSAIVFAGPAMIMTPGSMEMTTTVMGNSYTSTMSIFNFLYGAQAGLQLGVKLGDFTLSPFAMAQSLQGTSSITDDQGNTTNTDIPAYTTTSYGADLIYTPWGLTLSSVLQEAKKSDDQTPGFKTHIYTLSFTKQF